MNWSEYTEYRAESWYPTYVSLAYLTRIALVRVMV